jgi:hypothetical protein
MDGIAIIRRNGIIRGIDPIAGSDPGGEIGILTRYAVGTGISGRHGVLGAFGTRTPGEKAFWGHRLAWNQRANRLCLRAATYFGKTETDNSKIDKSEPSKFHPSESTCSSSVL